LLHPSLPATNRPQPPLSALHFFAKESDEERKLRRELGYSTADDAAWNVANGEMDVDDQENESVGVPLVEAKTPRVNVAVSAPQLSIPAFTPIPSAAPTVVEASPSVPVLAPAVPAPAAAPSAQPTQEAETTDIEMATDFMSAPAARSVETKVVETYERTVVVMGEDDDEPLPELDSGSSDEDDEEEEDEEEEEEEGVEE